MSIEADRALDWEVGRSLERKDATADRLRTAIREACDLLAERTHGNSARSPGHNARLLLEAALTPPDRVEEPK